MPLLSDVCSCNNSFIKLILKPYVAITTIKVEHFFNRRLNNFDLKVLFSKCP